MGPEPRQAAIPPKRLFAKRFLSAIDHREAGLWSWPTSASDCYAGTQQSRSLPDSSQKTSQMNRAWSFSPHHQFTETCLRKTKRPIDNTTVLKLAGEKQRGR